MTESFRMDRIGTVDEQLKALCKAWRNYSNPTGVDPASVTGTRVTADLVGVTLSTKRWFEVTAEALERWADDTGMSAEFRQKARTAATAVRAVEAGLDP
ncbi:MAG: hypothetical protein HZB39_18105 [Planctomycetes bacterium]|nr:hypothetical protein [Planctomycetota bacterium]